MSDNIRKAIAYLNLVLVEEGSRMWPRQKENLEGAVGELMSLLRIEKC